MSLSCSMDLVLWINGPRIRFHTILSILSQHTHALETSFVVCGQWSATEHTTTHCDTTQQNLTGTVLSVNLRLASSDLLQNNECLVLESVLLTFSSCWGHERLGSWPWAEVRNYHDSPLQRSRATQTWWRRRISNDWPP